MNLSPTGEPIAIGTQSLPVASSSLAPGTPGISPSTDAGPNNTASGMAAIISAIDNNTLSAVGNVLAGLPSVSAMTAGAYQFESQAGQAATSAYDANATQLQGFVSGNVAQITPAIAAMGASVTRNQAASIQAASNAGGGGKK